MKVRPFDGKYTVNCSDFFEKIDTIQRQTMPNDWIYRPLNSEIEITNRCNQSCPHCGMAANRVDCFEYTKDELAQYVQELYSLGIPSYSVTGGEPFLAFDKLIALIEAAKGKVDICKITTNGFWGDNADAYFKVLELHGLLSNRFFVPCLMVSIGEQSTPMKTTCRIFHYAIEHYSKEELTLCISSLHEYGTASKADEFIQTYRQEFGDVPSGRIYLTENYYRNSRCILEIAKSPGEKRIENYMSGPVRCFEQTIGKYVLPRLLVKATGETCTCACFNAPRELMTGNYRESSLREIIDKINNNKYVNIIARKGLQGFRELLQPEDYTDIPCNNECEACTHLIHSYQKRFGE